MQIKTVCVVITVIIIIIQFFNIIYVPSQQPQGQLQAQHSVDTDNYIMDKHNINNNNNNSIENLYYY
jgi:hypothetical protein